MKIVGHRGAAGLAPENTLTALEKGIEHAVDMLEFDLRVTKDHQVILHHDAFLSDPNGKQQAILELTYSEIKHHKADIATFEEALKVVKPSIGLYAEIKEGVDPTPILKTVKNYKNSNLFFASFDQSILRRLHKELPDTPLIVNERWSGVRARRRCTELDTKLVSMNQRWLWWGFIHSLARSGWQLFAYTLDSPNKATRWEKHGLYGVVTNYPDLFVKIK